MIRAGIRVLGLLVMAVATLAFGGSSYLYLRPALPGGRGDPVSIPRASIV